MHPKQNLCKFLNLCKKCFCLSLSYVPSLSARCPEVEIYFYMSIKFSAVWMGVRGYKLTIYHSCYPHILYKQHPKIGKNLS